MDSSKLRRVAPVLGLLVLVVAPRAASAQGLESSPCPQGFSASDPRRFAQDACTQAYDVFQLMAPQLAVSLAGGNAILGQGGTLGGVGHVSVGVRANVITGLIPDRGRLQEPSRSGAERRTLPTVDQVVGLATADAAVGLFGGVPLSFATVGSVDALLSATYVPTLDVSGVSITPERNVQVGYGLRVGLVRETPMLPSVSATLLKRGLPETVIETVITGTSGNTTLEVSTRSETTAWRLVAGKTLFIFGVAAGVGLESYDQSADVTASVSGPFTGSATLPGTSQSLSRRNYFLDASINLPVLKIAAEVGRVGGGTVHTFNSFEGGAADRQLSYASLGVRLGL
jgi:hypothetical protein